MINELDVAPRPAAQNVALPSNDPAQRLDADATRRWASEAEFFDKLGARLEGGLRPFTPAEVDRYVKHPRRIFDKEFRFRLLGDLHGKRVLDLGCGEGSNSVLLAKAGAQVEGVDISSKLVDLGRARAEQNGVASQVRLQCAPIETIEFPERSFDVIWGDGILHHLIDALEPTFRKLMRWAKPRALFLFSEPVNLNPLLRRLRLKVPIHTDATPDERPLEARELALVRGFLPELQLRHFHGLSRLTRFVVPLHAYETAPLHQRIAADALHTLDYALLRSPSLCTFGGMAVMWARLSRVDRFG